MKKSSNRYKTDYYARRARANEYAARSVYKLMELQQSYTFIRVGQWVLDIGAAPGSWSQYCSKIVGDVGGVVSVDPTPFSLGRGYHNTTIIEGDFFSPTVQERLAERRFNGVLSDVAPRTSGNKWLDACKLAQSVQAILHQLPRLLFENGFAILKLFESEETTVIREEMRPMFEYCYTRKPRASRSNSKEIYLIGFNYLSVTERR